LESFLSLDFAEVAGGDVELIHCGRDFFDRLERNARFKQKMLSGNHVELSQHSGWIYRDTGDIVVEFLQFMFKPVWNLGHALFPLQSTSGEPRQRRQNRSSSV
jgi:hypothetical protein